MLPALLLLLLPPNAPAFFDSVAGENCLRGLGLNVLVRARLLALKPELEKFPFVAGATPSERFPRLLFPLAGADAEGATEAISI